MKHTRLVTLFAACGTAGLGLTCAIGAIAEAHDHDHSPTQAEIDFASGTSDLMTNTLVAALVQEINETTPANAAQGEQSISLIFADNNRSMRLVGTLEPIGDDTAPADKFERDALALALAGQGDTAVERIEGQWYYRRSNPLSNFAPQCATCHANFASLSSTTWVGALMLRIPIDTN